MSLGKRLVLELSPCLQKEEVSKETRGTLFHVVRKLRQASNVLGHFFGGSFFAASSVPFLLVSSVAVVAGASAFSRPLDSSSATVSSALLPACSGMVLAIVIRAQDRQSLPG